MQITEKELDALIEQKAEKKIADFKEAIKSELGGNSNAIAEATEKAVKEIQDAAKKERDVNQSMLESFKAVNAENVMHGLKQESAKTVVNEMIGSALYAMNKFDKNNVKQVSPEEMMKAAEELYPHSKAMHAVIKQNTASVPSDGGFAVPVAFSADYIKALYANTILDKLGVTKVPLVNGNLSIPKMTASAKASWVGEAKKIGKKQPTFGEVNLKAKKLACICPISNDLIRYAGVGIDSWIADDMMMSARVALDEAFLNGAGTAYSPLGLANTTGIQTTGSNSTAIGITTPIDMMALLEKENIPMQNVKWIINPQVRAWLAGKTFTSGPFAWADEMARSKTLNGYDFITSSTVAYDGSGTPYGDIWIGDFSQVLWGVGYDMSVEMSREASFDDGTGNMISAYSNDLTLVRLITEHDFGVRQAKAFVKGTFKQNA